MCLPRWGLFILLIFLKMTQVWADFTVPVGVKGEPIGHVFSSGFTQVPDMPRSLLIYDIYHFGDEAPHLTLMVICGRAPRAQLSSASPLVLLSCAFCLVRRVALEYRATCSPWDVSVGLCQY